MRNFVLFSFRKVVFIIAKINDNIKRRRLDMGYTLLEMADFLGVKEATAQRYESGAIKTIGRETIIKLSEFLKCSPSALMGWEEFSPAPAVGLTDEETLLLNVFRKLNPAGREKLKERANELFDLGYVLKRADASAV